MSAAWTPNSRPRVSDDDVPLATQGLLSGVIAANPAAFAGFHALTVDDPRRRASLAAFQVTCLHRQYEADRFQSPAVPPVVEIALNRRVGREVLRRLHPLAARRYQIQDRVEYFPQICRARPSNAVRCRHKRRDQSPLGVAQVACITAAHPLDTHGERFRSRASISPFRLTAKRNHNPLIPLNSFRVGLLLSKWGNIRDFVSDAVHIISRDDFRVLA